MRSQLALVLVAGVGLALASVALEVDLGRLLLEPPSPVGWLFAAATTLVGGVVLLRAMARVGAGRDDARELIRAVRLLFVAVGCFAAAAGWAIGSALPIIAGLIIIAIDVLETTFLLLVTGGHDAQGSGSVDPGAAHAAATPEGQAR